MTTLAKMDKKRIASPVSTAVSESPLSAMIAAANPRTITSTGFTRTTASMMPAQRRTWRHNERSTKPE
jgi:hypothetical protein